MTTMLLWVVHTLLRTSPFFFGVALCALVESLAWLLVSGKKEEKVVEMENCMSSSRHVLWYKATESKGYLTLFDDVLRLQQAVIGSTVTQSSILSFISRGIMWCTRRCYC